VKSEGKVCLTIDLEMDWGGRVSSIIAIEKELSNILNFIESNRCNATIFVSGEILELVIGRLMEAISLGCEIASHGYHHNLRYDSLNLKEIEFQISYSKKIIEDTLGVKVKGFRTPQFRKNMYTDQLLLKSGYIYDSSCVESSYSVRYMKNQYESGDIISVPVAKTFIGFPSGIKWINLFKSPPINRYGIPTVVYLHLFDVLSIVNICKMYKRIISPMIFAFYFARIGCVRETAYEYLSRSQSIESALGYSND